MGLVTTGVAPAVILHTPAGASGGLAMARDSSISSAMNSSTVRLKREDWAYLCASKEALFKLGAGIVDGFLCRWQMDRNPC